MRRRAFLQALLVTPVVQALPSPVVSGIDWGIGPDRTAVIIMGQSNAVALTLIGTVSGRFSSSRPNLSAIPRPDV